MYKIKVPASTANVGPGYDTFGLALNLYNYVSVLPGRNPGKLTFSLSGERTRALRDANHNLVIRATSRVLELAGVKCGGWHLQLINNIPVSRGLGSSAAAIVGGLVAGNTICGGKFSPDELLQLANELEGHPDNVAPALLGGFVAAAPQADGSIARLCFAAPAGLRYVIAIPDFYLSTRQVRTALPKRLSREDAVFNLQRAVLTAGALAQGDLDLFARVFDDRLHQQYRIPFITGSEAVMQAARQAGALAAGISGAGPTLIAFCRPDTAAAVSAAMQTAWQEYDVAARTLILEQDTVGACLIPEEES